MPLFTTSGNSEGVRGVNTSTPQPPPEKDKQKSESEMETDLSEGEMKDSMSEDNLDAWQESKEDTVTQASAIVSEWTAQILHGREEVLKLPKADPTIPLVREIAKQANFSLTERPSGNEFVIELVYAGIDGAWEDLAQFDSCEEPLQTKGSTSQLTGTDPEDVIVMNETVFDDLGGSLPSLSGAGGSLEDQVPPWPRTEPSHPYQPPQILEARDGWYRVEDCFNPGEIAPEASPPQLPSQDGGLDWGGEEALPPLPEGLPPYRGRVIQRAAHYSRTAKGSNGKRSHLPERTRQDRCGVGSHYFKSEAFWRQEVRQSQYFPAMDQSSIPFFPPDGFGVGLKAVPYSVMVPLALEVPYLDGLAQEALQDGLIPASLCMA